MERYYFKTMFQDPSEECLEKCNVRTDGTKIGSYNCITCQYHVENDMTDNDLMTWLKCSKLKEALSVNVQTIAKPIIIGCFYGQEITGTLYNYKVINCQGNFNGKDYYLVENVATGFRHTISGCDLHSL